MGKNWQLLGEVPDSDDDDGLDSQDSLADVPVEQGLFFGDLNDGDHSDHGDHGDNTNQSRQPVLSVVLSPRPSKVVDVTPANPPASPRRPATPTPVLTDESSTLSFPPTDLDDLNDLDDDIDLVGDGVEDQLPQFNRPDEEPEDGMDQDTPRPSPRLPSQTPQLPPQLPPQPPAQAPPEEARALPLASSPTSSLSSLSRSPSPMLLEPAPPSASIQQQHSSVHRESSPPFVFPVLPDSPPTFRLGFVRSLRPRKPIQQHPYLLENAQYAQAMKKHGMKPVRTEYSAAAPAHRKHAVPHDDSQSQDVSQEDDRRQAQQDVFSDPAFIDDDVYDFPTSPTARGSRTDRPELPSFLSPSTSTPAHRQLFSTSSQGIAGEGTDGTSMADDDDFPSFEAHRKRQVFGNKAKAARTAKRPTSSPTSSAAKRARVLDVALQAEAPRIARTPPRAKWIPVPFSSSPDPLPRPTGRMRVVRSSSPPIPPPPPPPQRETYTIPDETSEAESEADDTIIGLAEEEDEEDEEEVQNDADNVREHRKRIKGVLPASWLRLDQQKATRVTNDRLPATQRRPGQTDNTPRRGVALPRQGTGSASLAPLAAIFDESDDDNEPTTSSNIRNSNNESNNDINETTTQRSRPKITTTDLWSDETDDDDDGFPVYRQTVDDDDIGSVMEADVIDRMESGPSRHRSSGTGARSQPRKLTKKPSFASSLGSAPSQKTRQPKIDRLFDRAAASSIAHQPRKAPTKKSGQVRGTSGKSSTSKPRPSGHRTAASGTNTRKRRPRVPSTPPLLSILDFVEPASAQNVRQPDFIRVAARTARKTKVQGKASPSRKYINLGSRSDNVDALSVLHDWRAGKIRPRIPNPACLDKAKRRPAAQAGSSSGRTSRPAQHPPLHEISTNLPRQPNHASHASHPKGMARTDSGSRATAAPTQPATKKAYANRIAHPRLAPRRSDALAPMRPAQLETTAARSSRQDSAGFVAKKKALDDMYRRRRREAAALPSVHLEQFIDDQASNYGSVDAMELDDDVGSQQPPPAAPAKSTPRAKGVDRSRFRKRYNPQAVDTSAPRFVHALDPLPVSIGPATVDLAAAEKGAADPDPGKLRGLGPYGSQYPQHFDVFPLDGGVFFHQSTLLGSGRLAAALGTHLATDVPPATRVATFQLDARTLSWSAWDDVSSSEYGIVMDWLTDSLFSASGPVTPLSPRVHALVNFVLDFIQTTMFAETATADTRKAFVLRSMEVVAGLVKRFESASIMQPTAEPTAVHNTHLAALTGAVAVVAWLLRICRETPACRAYSFHVEDMLTKAARVTARALWKHGLEDVRVGYNDLQRPSVRDRGIRRDLQALCSWVVLVQTLEHARIPRSGFWDVTYWAMQFKAPVAIHACSDAGRLEQLWEGLFTLLPLTEFDSAGVVQAGMRQSMPVDGWELPKKMLERVFQLYKTNPHQSASFNAYCRTLVGRCHYLVQEWGWRNSSKSVIGTIFDFYGSQDYAHLRNEEVYRSPQFLEMLAADENKDDNDNDGPSLAIVPEEDKCFHIFLKMLGLVVLELKRLGLGKEMTNLVARILPNHDRQYVKEADVHERDLAALRNHHDLLCTLYWAASAEVRPALHQIEKLVEPARSHKEAVLINIRAWSQLARFVVAGRGSQGGNQGSGGSGYGVFRGFEAWMRNIFGSMLEQYQSAEADMERQFRNLSTSMMQGIGVDMVRAMAAANRAAAMDVLQACAAASLDVLRHAPTLGVATYCLSTEQLEAVLGGGSSSGGSGGSGGKLDLLAASCTNWAILQTALDTLEHYMGRIDAVMDAQYASLGGGEGEGEEEVSGGDDTAQADEAVLLLDHSPVAKSLFRLVNSLTHMAWDDLPGSVAATRVACTERGLVLAARLVSRFVHAGMYNLGKFFGGSGSGSNNDSYAIFERLPHAPGLMQRKFLPLFVSALVSNNVFDFKDMGGGSGGSTNLLEQWLLAIVKPARLLGYENRLARVLQQHDLPYVRRASIPANAQAMPDYGTNQAYFACAMASMRQQLRAGGGGSSDGTGAAARRQQQQLRSEYARALRLVMQQIKDDLRHLAKSAAGTTTTAHNDYVLFVRGIVALLRSHGGDICPLDDFFYSQSVDYAPSPEDPQLRAASIVTYGLRLGEGEATAAPQLFYYLHNSFTIALANGALAQECRVLERSMREDGRVLGFMLGRMLPAILRVGAGCLDGPDDEATSTACWPLLDVYCTAVEQFLTRAAVPPAVDDDVLVDAVASLFEGVVQLLVAGFAGGTTASDMLPVRVRTLAQLVSLANVLRPLVMACECLPACPEATHVRLRDAIAALYELVAAYGGSHVPPEALLTALQRGGSRNNVRLSREMFATSTGPPPPQIEQFSTAIARHAKDNWIVDDDGSIRVRRLRGAPGPTATTTSGSDGYAGHVPFSWTMADVVGELQRQLRRWTLKPAHLRFPGPGSRRRLFPGRLRVVRQRPRQSGEMGEMDEIIG